MGLEDPRLGVLGSLAESQPLLRPPPLVSSGPRGAGGCSEACCRGEVGTSGHRDKARDKVTSQGWRRKVKQGTIRSYINPKFKTADWDLQWSVREHQFHPRPTLPYDLGAGSHLAPLAQRGWKCLEGRGLVFP